ncbi:cytochrome P450 6B6-like [Helicoverpa armigera]|uniref:cytochrome P450 6B6-like n=1 Tax=Helicoverpa armigera TaxID=29058 RepID=UPI0021123550|nr:cytochrome P450 6B6-like [Helicoverpa armigera]WRX05937.1 CYP6AB20 [Helicoverpa armigera]
MIFLALLLVGAVALYLYGTRNHDYWKKKGVKHDKPIPLFGTDAKRYLLQSSIAQMSAETYWKYPNERFVGYYRGAIPELVIRDPDLVKQIITTDFAYFYSRGLSPAHKVIEPLLRNLFFADGDLWKLLRQRMTPAFTSGKLKAMFPLIVERAERLQARALAAAAAGRPLDARDLMARYTTDFIGACGFGLDADSLNDENSPFRKLGMKIFNITFKRTIVIFCKTIFPDFFKKLKFLGQDLEDDILALVNQIQKQRNYKPSGRNDFIDFLMEWQQRGKIIVESLEETTPEGKPKLVELEMDDVLVAAQAFIFFAAGFETSSSATSFTLHQLAFHPEVQRRAQADVDRVLARHGNKLSYDAVKEMTYLDWVLQEGMRIFPSSGMLLRQCVRPYTIPGTDITIDKGVKINIPLVALHNDPQYFDNPSEFRPERFAPEEVAKRHKFVYLPFGDGPRSCIGGRLGQMQSLAGLAAVLAKFSVSPAPETRRELVSDPKSSIVQNIVGGIPLMFEARHPPAPLADDNSRSL